VNTALLRFRSKSERQFRESGCALGAIWIAPDAQAAVPADTHVLAESHAADLSRENIEHPAVTITLPAIIHTTARMLISFKSLLADTVESLRNLECGDKRPKNLCVSALNLMGTTNGHE
jgi:hypothetical protein